MMKPESSMSTVVCWTRRSLIGEVRAELGEITNDAKSRTVSEWENEGNEDSRWKGG